jgi:hypothetical protein
MQPNEIQMQFQKQSKRAIQPHLNAECNDISWLCDTKPII